MLCFFSPLTTNIYLLAIPAIADAFSKPIELINLTVTAYMVLQGVCKLRCLLEPQFLFDNPAAFSSYDLGFVIGSLRTTPDHSRMLVDPEHGLRWSCLGSNIKLLGIDVALLHTSRWIREHNRVGYASNMLCRVIMVLICNRCRSHR